MRCHIAIDIKTKVVKADSKMAMVVWKIDIMKRTLIIIFPITIVATVALPLLFGAKPLESMIAEKIDTIENADVTAISSDGVDIGQVEEDATPVTWNAEVEMFFVPLIAESKVTAGGSASHPRDAHSTTGTSCATFKISGQGNRKNLRGSVSSRFFLRGRHFCMIL